MMMFSFAFVDFLKPQMKYYGNSKPFKDDRFLTAVGTAAFISSAISRFAIGAI
jgi:hypothetical protein